MATNAMNGFAHPHRAAWLAALLAAIAITVWAILATGGGDPATEHAERAPVPDETAPIPPEPGIAPDEYLKAIVPTGLDGPMIPERFDIDWSRSGFWDLDMVEHVTLVEAERLERGFVEAYGLVYMTPDFAPSFFDAGPGSAGQDLALMVIRYDNRAAAALALGQLQRFDVWDDPLTMVGDPSADTGFVIGGEPVKRGSLSGLPTVAVSWRVGDLVLLVGAQGGTANPSLAPRVVAPVAELLNARVLSSETSPPGGGSNS